MSLDVVRSLSGRIHFADPHDLHDRTECGRRVAYHERLVLHEIDHTANYLTCGGCLSALVERSAKGCQRGSH